jgi:hypothetical protein
MFSIRDGALLRTCCGERLLIEPWGRDALRVRSTMQADFGQERLTHSEKFSKMSCV